MGVLSEAVKKVDNSEQQKTEISENLNLLVELTKSKAEEYKNQIEDNLNRGRILGKGDSADSLYFPISSVKDSRVEYRCITSNTPTDLVDVIGASIVEMIDDHSAKGIVKGISGIVSKAMQPLLGLSEGAEQYCSTTTTFVEGNGLAMSIMRFDCIIWGRSIRAESIKKQVEKTLACVAYKSVVNVKKISFDDFRAVYSPLLSESGETDIITAIKKAKEIYELLDGGKDLEPKVTAVMASNGIAKKMAARPKEIALDNLMACSKAVMATEGNF